MSGYLLGVIGMVLFCTVLTMVLPQGKTTTLVQAIARLACILTILAPIPSFFGENGLNFGQSSIQPDTDFISYYSELRLKEAETTLEIGLKEKYDKQADVTIYFGWEELGVKVYEIGVCGDFSAQERTEIAEKILEDYGVEAAFYDGN